MSHGFMSVPEKTVEQRVLWASEKFDQASLSLRDFIMCTVVNEEEIFKKLREIKKEFLVLYRKQTNRSPY